MTDTKNNNGERKLREISDEELKKVLEEHTKWLVWRAMSDWKGWEGDVGKQADLSYTNLQHRDLRAPDSEYVHLEYANFFGAHFSRGTVINFSNFTGADLRFANLEATELVNAQLDKTDLSNANLEMSDLKYANLSHSKLIDANLQGSSLIGANLYLADLKNATLDFAQLGFTIFDCKGLEFVQGLESVMHIGPSLIGINTILEAKGKISESFLRKVGIPRAVIDFIPSFIGSIEPFQYYSCFISYSNKNQDFADRLYSDLQNKGVRCFYASADMKTGERIRSRIDQAIQANDKLLLILSDQSIESKWVEDEVETAFEKEHKQKRTVLFPIRVDSAVMETDEAWAANIRRTRHIGDFEDWKNHDSYQTAFDRLLEDLKAADEDQD